MSVARAYLHQNVDAVETKRPARSVTRPLDCALRSKCLIMVIMIFALAAGVTFLSETLMRSGYELVVLKQQLTQMEQENEILRVVIAKQKSPQRIQNIATQELGLVVPEHVYCAQGKTPQPVAMDKASSGTGMWERFLGFFGQGRAEAAILRGIN